MEKINTELYGEWLKDPQRFPESTELGLQYRKPQYLGSTQVINNRMTKSFKELFKKYKQ